MRLARRREYIFTSIEELDEEASASDLWSGMLHKLRSPVDESIYMHGWLMESEEGVREVKRRSIVTAACIDLDVVQQMEDGPESIRAAAEDCVNVLLRKCQAIVKERGFSCLANAITVTKTERPDGTAGLLRAPIDVANNATVRAEEIFEFLNFNKGVMEGSRRRLFMATPISILSRMYWSQTNHLTREIPTLHKFPHGKSAGIERTMLPWSLTLNKRFLFYHLSRQLLPLFKHLEDVKELNFNGSGRRAGSCPVIFEDEGKIRIVASRSYFIDTIVYHAILQSKDRKAPVFGMCQDFALVACAGSAIPRVWIIEDPRYSSILRTSTDLINDTVRAGLEIGTTGVFNVIGRPIAHRKPGPK
jgi:hypothetical protein